MLPAVDLNHCFDGVGRHWDRLRGKRIFVTGGTGVIGKWLLETLLHADRRLALGASAVVLSRNPEKFAQVAPHLAYSDRLLLMKGDVRSFAFPEGNFDYVIHAATDVVAPAGSLDVFDTCVAGTRRVLDFAALAGARDVLLLSSGAVYGRQPPDVGKMPESFGGGPEILNPKSAYGEGKRVSEWLGATYTAGGQLSAKAARVYALVGPYVPLDKHFAIGNFIGDGLANRPIRVLGDGTTVRSYLHTADVAVWLWTILLAGRAGAAYNVGSDAAIALGDLAHRVAALLAPDQKVEILGRAPPGSIPERYVPDTSLARRELGLEARIGLDEAILRTASWYREGEEEG
jgi:dTDP-glucose 4,6-dehydratase